MSFAQEIDNVAVVFDEFIEIVPAQLVYAEHDIDFAVFQIIAQRVGDGDGAGLGFDIRLGENVRNVQADVREVRGVLKIGIVHDAFHARIADERGVLEPRVILGLGRRNGQGVVVCFLRLTCHGGGDGGIIVCLRLFFDLARVGKKLLHPALDRRRILCNYHDRIAALSEDDCVFEHLNALGTVQLEGLALHLASALQCVGQGLHIRALGRNKNAYLVRLRGGGVCYGIVAHSVRLDAVIIVKSVFKALIVRAAERIGALGLC